MSLSYLTLEEVLRLHFQIIEDFGGSHGVREETSLLSVIKAPSQNVFGKEQYPSIYEKSAVYLRNVAMDHPFIDGNKRTALAVCGIFLARHGYHLIVEPKVLEDFMISVVTSNLGIKEIAGWLKQSSEDNASKVL